MVGGIKGKRIMTEKKEPVVTDQEKEVETDCSICMGKTEKPMTYQCCKQLVCQECYREMHVERKRKDCPYCRHNPIIALTTPLRGGITKKRQSEGSPRILINKSVVAPIIKEILGRHGLKITSEAVTALRIAMEDETVKRMQIAQVYATHAGKATVDQLYMQ